MERRRLLIVDDEPGICDLVAETAKPMGYVTETAHDGSAFEERFAKFWPDLVVLDLRLPGHDGIELLRFLANRGYRGKLILLSGTGSRVLESAERVALSHGLQVLGHAAKPLDMIAFERILETAPEADSPTISAEELRAAIGNGELFVEYQPKIALCGASPHQIEGVEALVRWRHEMRGLILPEEFIGLADSNRMLSSSLTHFVLRSALQQARYWLDDGHALSVAVNLPAGLVNDTSLPDRIDGLLSRYNLEAAALILEITETGILPDIMGAMEALTRLRLKGVQLSIDDFGTGNSSLVQLYRMPFSELKVDRSFVTELERSQEARVIVRSIINLAHGLGMVACAEGVESEHILDLLRSWNCDKAQGYHIGRPMAGDGIHSLMSQGRLPPTGARRPEIHAETAR